AERAGRPERTTAAPGRRPGRLAGRHPRGGRVEALPRLDPGRDRRPPRPHPGRRRVAAAPRAEATPRTPARTGLTMPTNPPSEGGPLGEVIARYLQAVERGEAPDRAAILAAHPELAAELAAYFADLDRMNRVAAPLKMSVNDMPTYLGDAPTVALPV